MIVYFEQRSLLCSGVAIRRRRRRRCEAGTMDEASSSALIDKLVRLRAELKRAGEFFDPSAPDGGRLGSFMAIGSVTEFLSSIGGTDPAMLVPLRQLQYALADLDRGNVVPLLARKKAAHRPPDPCAKEAFRAAVAGTIERNEIGSLTFICHVRRGRRVVHELRCSAANGALFHQSSILWEELTCSRNIVNRFFQ
jgi:hypothetical protein